MEKHHLIAGDKFGHEKGKIFTVAGALCGLKSASAAFRSFMAEKSDEMNFASSTADPDALLHPAIEPDGSEFVIVFCAALMTFSPLVTIPNWHWKG